MSALPSLAQGDSTTVVPGTAQPTSAPSTSAQPTSAPSTSAPSTPTTAPARSTAGGSTTSTTADPSGGSATTAAAPTTANAPAPSITSSAADREAKAVAAGRLNAALAADSEIAAGLRAINEVAQNTQSKIDRAERSLEAARTAAATAAEELTRSAEQQALVKEQLLAKAVEGFKTGLDGGPPVFFTDRSVNLSIRQTQLLHQANKGTAELLEELRILQEDQQVAQAQAAKAAADAEKLQAELAEELAALQEQQSVQLRLKREAESRINRWEGALSAYAAEDRGIQTLLSGSSAAPVAVAVPRQPSVLGFQWPVDGPVTSGYGYRVHPVYGSRKLHSGLDVSSPRGTPIAAATDGVVLSAGWRGGYGQTVIVDHGDGVSTLYAHMSQITASEGNTVRRGDQLGLVGATGTATGNHLHFEVRVGGQATDPRPYLP